MVYSPPTLAQLRTKVATDLRDPGLKTFTAGEVDALIGEGISEVSRIYPVETIDSIPFIDGQAEYDTPFEEVFRVELFRSGVYQATIPSNQDDDSAQGGFDLFAGQLHLPWSRIPYMYQATDALRVWGYTTRDQLTADTDVFDGDADAEYGVRTYAALSGYQRLLNSRALFQQWTIDSANTDMGPRWLMSTAQTFESQWQRIRQQLRTLRRR